jgi:hypothetical protein
VRDRITHQAFVSLCTFLISNKSQSPLDRVGFESFMPSKTRVHAKDLSCKLKLFRRMLFKILLGFAKIAAKMP